MVTEQIMEGFSRYLVESKKSKNTALSYKKNVRNYIIFCQSNKREFNITYDQLFQSLHTYIQHLKSEGYKYETVRQINYALMSFFMFLEIEYQTPRTEMPILIKNDFGKKSSWNLIHDSEVMGIILFANSIRNKFIIKFLYETGMKRGEFLRCRIEDLNIERRIVNIYDDKGNLDRVGYFSEETSDLLGRYLEELQRELKLKSIHRSDYLLQTSRSNPMSYSTIFRIIKEAANAFYCNKFLKEGHSKKEAIKKAIESCRRVNTDTLRHSRRAWYFSQGLNVNRVQIIMGDENLHVCKMHEKLAQNIYPEMFLDQ